MRKKWTVLYENWFEGDITLSKATLWLACAVCLLAGIVYGLRKAPWTHGVMIGSNNGNNSGNGKGCGREGCEGCEEEKAECCEEAAK